jgi:hypothetical protein
MSGALFDASLVGGASFGATINDVIAFTAPTLSTARNIISTNAGDIDGGYTVTLTGTNFTGATGVTFGGVAATSVLVVNATTITCTAPAHASGTVDVIVTNPGGTNAAGNNAWEYVSPAQFSATLWQRDYAGTAPWAGTSSAGTSGSNSLVTGGSNPSSGTALNGHGTALFNGTTNTLTTSVNITSVVSNGAGSCLALFNASAAAADPGASLVYKNPPFLNDGGAGNFNFGYTTSGVRGGYYNGVAWDSVAQAAATASWHLAQMKWDGTTLKVRADSGAWVPLPMAAVSALTATPGQIGLNAFGGVGLSATVAELLALQSTLSDANFDKLRGYYATRFNLSTI